jgi:DNA replication protein DnaC
VTVEPRSARTSDPDGLGEILAGIRARIPAPTPLTPEQQDEVDRRIERERWGAAAERIGVPRRFLKATIRSERATEALTFTRDFVRSGSVGAGRCLVLAGASQIGKTYAAVALLRAFPEAGRRFIYFPALCAAIMGREREQLDVAKRTGLVVLDDLGTEYVKRGGFVEAVLDEIVWQREAEQLPTVVTTNLTAAQLGERFSDRILNRLRGEWGVLRNVGGPRQIDGDG